MIVKHLACSHFLHQSQDPHSYKWFTISYLLAVCKFFASQVRPRADAAFRSILNGVSVHVAVIVGDSSLPKKEVIAPFLEFLSAICSDAVTEVWMAVIEGFAAGAFAWKWMLDFLGKAASMKVHLGEMKDKFDCTPLESLVQKYFELRSIAVGLIANDEVGTFFTEDALVNVRRHIDDVIADESAQDLRSVLEEKFAGALSDWKAMAADPANNGQVVPEFDKLHNLVQKLDEPRVSKQMKVIGQIIKAGCREAALSKKWRASESSDSRIISDEWINIISPVRQDLMTLKSLRQGEGDAGLATLFKPDASYDNKDPLALHFLEGSVEADRDVARCTALLENTLATIYSDWGNTVGTLSAHLESWCPGWQTWLDSEDFPSPEHILALCKNSDYPKLTPYTSKLSSVLSAAKTLTQMDSAGHVFSPEVLKKAADVKRLALDTVNLTYCVFKLWQDTNTRNADAAGRKKIVAELRASLAQKSYQIPKAIEKKMKELSAE